MAGALGFWFDSLAEMVSIYNPIRALGLISFGLMEKLFVASHWLNPTMQGGWNSLVRARLWLAIKLLYAYCEEFKSKSL